MNYSYQSISLLLASIFFMLISIVLCIGGIFNLSTDKELYAIAFLLYSMGQCLFATWNEFWNNRKIRFFQNKIFVRIGYTLVIIACNGLLIELGNYLYIYRIHFPVDDNSRTLIYFGAFMWIITLRAKKGRLFLFF
jgi:hypothetical protein